MTYIGLPISSGGAHSLGRMSRRDAYANTMSFLQTCTEPVSALDYALEVNDVPELKPDPGLEREVQRRFGRDGWPGPRGKRVRIHEARVDDVLDFLDEIDPQPTNPWGMAPIWFWTSSKFRIRDPLSGRALPGQDPNRFGGVEYDWRVPLGSSGLRLILRNGAAISIELCIPDADEDLLHRVVPFLQQHLPFKFSPQQWRVWTPTRSGSFKGRKMVAPG